MVKRKLIVINGQQYWTNKEIPKEKKKGFLMKGLSLVGQGAKIVGKEIGKASLRYAEEQKKQQQAPQQNPNNKEGKKMNSGFFSSGFGV